MELPPATSELVNFELTDHCSMLLPLTSNGRFAVNVKTGRLRDIVSKTSDKGQLRQLQQSLDTCEALRLNYAPQMVLEVQELGFDVLDHIVQQVLVGDAFMIQSS